MVQAYSESFLAGAMENLGEAVEYAVKACGLDPDEFMGLFINSGIAGRFEDGDPMYNSYRSGTEMAREVMENGGLKRDFPPALDGETTDAYWAGWVLAYCQWQTGRSFREIQGYISVKDVIDMYYSLHEAAESEFVDVLEAIIARKDGNGQ